MRQKPREQGLEKVRRRLSTKGDAYNRYRSCESVRDAIAGLGFAAGA